jgi:cytochrome c biogenesis protein CcmG/thiol:disulfide interchange protein DsbE
MKKFLVLALLSGCSGAHGAGSVPRVATVGALAPGFTEQTAAGKKLSLHSLAGKPIYLNFFATWCEPCNEEAPDINALQKQFAGSGLHVVGVDELESAKAAQQFIRKYHLVYPALVDEGTLEDEYAVNGLPVHVFIDRSGVIRRIVRGQMSRTEIEAAIRSIL